AVLFPSAIFSWLDMPQPNYPQFWQCIGMIVGVYGDGYAIAAFDPVRHWPIVLVGFLGKVFGPLGMVQALWSGQLPWGFALNCVTNDLIWWVPFFLILKHAWDEFQSDPRNDVLPEESALLAEARDNRGSSLAELSQKHPLLLVCLRHSGCTFCREALADLSVGRASIEKNGTKLVLVHMGTVESFSAFTAKYGLSDVSAISDPERRLYRGLGLRRGKLSQLFGWRVWWRGQKSFFEGHRPGALEGDGTQMPGVFLIQRGRVVRRFIHADAADRPDYAALAELPA
ncbi:MAG: SelL-related redox protein, partial [Chthoniobacteraceae bacterium]|nr:SelL-related redox protein [Chthoniobacteraceae bacterium]